MTPAPAPAPRPRPPHLLTAFLASAALLLTGGGSRADAPVAASALSARVVALRSNAGQIGCLLFNSRKGFPKDPAAAVQRVWCPIAGSAASCAFDPVPVGTYAVACFHDENKNGKLDTGLFGIPKEGTVASNQAKGFMGPPSFDDAKFRYTGSALELRLTMGY